MIAIQSKYYLFIYSLVLIAITTFLFWPFFVTEFGMHNDYSMITSDKTSIFGFRESSHLARIGRPLGAIILSIHCMLTNSVADFTITRIVSFILSIISSSLIAFFLYRRCNWSWFFAISAAFCTFLIPSNLLFIVWATNLVPGTLNTLLAICAYLLFDWAQSSNLKSRDLKGLLFVLAALLFLISLMIYPPSSMVIFALSFCLLINQHMRNHDIPLKRFLWDAIFFGIVMFIYFVLNKFWIHPMVIEYFDLPVYRDPLYQLDMFGQLANKWPAVLETLHVSISGPWHFLATNFSIAIPTIFTLLILTILLIKKQLKPRNIIFIVLSIITYLTLTNLPAWIAKGVNFLIGYRVISSCTVLTSLFAIWLFKMFHNNYPKISKIITAIYLIGICVVCHSQLQNFHRNQISEASFIENNIKSFNPQTTANLLIMPRNKGNIIVNKPLPFEFAYMITELPHIKPLISEISTKNNIDLSRVRIAFVPIGSQNRFSQKIPFTHTIDMRKAQPIK